MDSPLKTASSASPSPGKIRVSLVNKAQTLEISIPVPLNMRLFLWQMFDGPKLEVKTLSLTLEFIGSP